MSTDTIKINIQGSLLKFDLAVHPTDTISTVKDKICSQVMSDTAPTALKLIYSGRILRDGQTVEECGLREGHTVHLVKSSASKPASASTTSTIAPNQPAPTMSPSTDQSRANHPSAMDLMMAGMMEEMANNPQAFAEMMASAPQAGLAGMDQSQLQMAQNPEFLRMAAHMIRSGMLSADSMSGLSGMNNLHNSSGLSGINGMAANVTAAVSPTNTSGNPEERFQSQLQQLQDMGFWDKKSNIQALLIANGSVSQAIEYLLAHPPE